MKAATSLLLLMSLAACSGEPRPEAAERPNVLFLFTDDQRFDTIHALGQEEIRTPNLDRLAARGTAFTRAHIMGGHHGALCAPSRAMLMTGRGLYDLHETGDVIPDDHRMMPERFAEAGYVTFGTGKWHNNKSAYARAFQHGDNIFFGGMHWPRDGGHEAPHLHHFDSLGAYPNEAQWQGEGFSSQLFADAAIDFLNDQKDSDQPFFAYVAFSSPHDPRTAPEPYSRWYAPDSVSLPPNFLPEHPFDNGELRVRDEMLRAHPRTPQIAREELAAYYAMISEVDAQIGRLLDALEANGQLDNTVIVFAGDNGLAVGSHGLLGKQNLYEHSVRVPLILAGPGIPRDETRNALVYLFDLFPTLTALADVPTPPTVQGRSLTPVLDDPAAAFREAVFYGYRDLQRGARTADNWKLIRYNVEGASHTQVFNLNEDPYERRNLADDPAYAAQRERLETLLLQQSRAYHDPLDLADPAWGKAPAEQPLALRHAARGKPVRLAAPFSPKYPGQGAAGLTDGIGCTSDFGKDCWHAYEQGDLDAVIDLGAPQQVEEVSARFLRNIRAWIFLPVEVDVALSLDGERYETMSEIALPPPAEADSMMIAEMPMGFELRQARYVRLRARNQGFCPDWHNGAGGKAWLFVDEIMVR